MENLHLKFEIVSKLRAYTKNLLKCHLLYINKAIENSYNLWTCFKINYSYKALL